jgi:hypothetical protein
MSELGSGRTRSWADGEVRGRGGGRVGSWADRELGGRGKCVRQTYEQWAVDVLLSFVFHFWGSKMFVRLAVKQGIGGLIHRGRKRSKNVHYE